MLRTSVALIILLTTAEVSAENWNRCRSALSYLADAAQRAKSEASDLETRKQESDDAAEKYDRCRRWPDTDTWGDRCETLQQKARRARQNYESEVANVQSAVARVKSLASDVESACVSRPSGKAPICMTLEQMRGSLSDADLLAACVKAIGDTAVCRACLSTSKK